jgi:Family of unknown function (DUF6677)
VDRELHKVTSHGSDENRPVTTDAPAVAATELSAEPEASEACGMAIDSSAETSVEVEPSLARRGTLARAARSFLALIVVALAWLVPGLGHLVMRRWQRAAAFFVAVGGLAVSGLLMRGNVFHLHSQDPFGTLGFLADASSGVFYLLAHTLERAGPDVARAMGDYGTRFIAGAGIVNMLGVCDAYEVARGRRY